MGKSHIGATSSTALLPRAPCEGCFWLHPPSLRLDASHLVSSPLLSLPLRVLLIPGG